MIKSTITMFVLLDVLKQLIIINIVGRGVVYRCYLCTM